MKLLKLLGVLGLMALLVPLSGCIGEEKAPAPKVTGGSEISEGVPPAKFTFEPLNVKATGEVVRERRERTTGVEGLPPPLSGTTVEWRLTWNVTGLVPLGTGDTGEEVGEIFYNVWIGRHESSDDPTMVWELASRNAEVAKEGTISGNTNWQRRFQNYVAVMVTLETNQDSLPEVTLLRTPDMEAGNTDPHPLEYQKTFSASFAEAKVVIEKDGKVNLTVTGFSLPESNGAYDVFLKNPTSTKFLGTLKFDAAAGGHRIAVSPSPDLFTKYQFFISLEQAKDKKDVAGGYKILESRFSA